MAMSRRKGKLVNTKTGEILDPYEVVKAYDDDVKNTLEQSKKELFEMGLNTNLKLVPIKVRNKNQVLIPIKTDYDFNKIFRVEFRELIKKGVLSKNCRCIIGTLSSFISFPENSVMVDGEYPKQDVLMKLIGLSKTPFTKALKDLEYYDVISRKRIGRNSAIYFNPFLIGVGNVSKETVFLFKDSIYNPYRV